MLPLDLVTAACTKSTCKPFLPGALHVYRPGIAKASMLDGLQRVVFFVVLLFQDMDPIARSILCRTSANWVSARISPKFTILNGVFTIKVCFKNYYSVKKMKQNDGII